MMKSYKCPGCSLADLGCCKHFDYSSRDFWANPISLNQSDTVALCEKNHQLSILFPTENKKKGVINDLFIYLCAVGSPP